MDRNMGSALNVISSIFILHIFVRSSTINNGCLCYKEAFITNNNRLSHVTSDFQTSRKKKEAIKPWNTSQANLKSQDHGTLMSR